ncbi:hypothetical protein [Legionella fallonii]|uniref:Protein SidH n=1 Tax=Legionella fallonii LLAP-10 TaxID=1212491 RepID=A0A098GAP8_9GAMM|nr:hypothetical protein [Legionella fallonii]CEG59100.1 protein of unknown function [6 coiled coil domains] [Legionella fallonii LLAP-10]
MGIHAKTREFLDYFRKLELSNQCNDIRTDLTMLVTNKNIFSEVLTEQLMPSATGAPYHLSSDDPEQIAVIKKLSNILYNTETLLSELEQIELTDDMYTAELAQHAPQVFKNTCSAINQIYDAIQLVNNSSASIQAIMPTQFEKIQESCIYLCQKLSQFTSSETREGIERTEEDTIGNTVGEAIGEIISKLPTERRSSESIDFFDTSKVLINIPGYIGQLQNIINKESLFPTVTIDEAPEDYHRRMEQRAKSLATSLEKATIQTGARQNWHMISAVKKINSLTIELINASADRTKEAYEKAEEKLDQLKHEILPQIISELESIEESIGLKSGTLTEPALESAQTYYKQLATLVETIPQAAQHIDSFKDVENKWYAKILRKNAKITPKEELSVNPNLSIFIDSSFVEKRQALQRGRLNEAKAQLHETKQSLKAAEVFFEKIASLNTVYNNGQLSDISVEEKQELAHRYKQFQSHMSATNLKLDTKIVNYLNLTELEKEQLKKGKQESDSLFQSLWSGLTATGRYAQKMAMIATSFAQSENEFNTILDSQNKVLKSLQKEMATQQQRVKLIESTQVQTEKNAQALLGGSALEVDASIPQIITFKRPLNNIPQKLHEQSLELEYQIKKIDEAKTAFAQFAKQLNTITDKSKTLSSLSQEEKEQLKAQFKQVQPYIRLLGEGDIKMDRLNARVVASLMNTSPQEEIGNEITIGQLLDFQSPISDYLTQLKSNSEVDKGKCIQLENEERKLSISSPITLAPIGITAKNSLFYQLSTMGLSTKIHDYLHEKIIPYLQENLSEDLLHELNLNGDRSKLEPYTVSNDEASQVSLYKNVINSFLHLEQALKGFEKKGEHEYTESTLSQALFLGTTGLSVGGAIYNAYNAVAALHENAQLEALLQQGIDLVTPMKQLPGLAAVFEKDPNKVITQAVYDLQHSLVNLVKNTEPPYLHRHYIGIKEKFMARYAGQLNEAEASLGLEKGGLLTQLNDVLSTVEQNIKKELNDLSPLLGKVTHPDWEDIAQDDSEKSIDHMNQYKTNSIHSFLLSGSQQLQNLLKGLVREEEPDPNKKMAEAIRELQHALLHLVRDTNPLYLQEHYEKLKEDFMEQHANQLSDMETALDLEKGSLLTQLDRIFDDTEQQIKEELDVLNLHLGGAVHPDWQKITPLYEQLEKALNQDPVIKNEIETIYRQLRGYLDEGFTENFISSTSDHQQLIAAAKQLLATEKVFNPVGTIVELQDAFYYEELDFSDDANQKMLRDHYDLLQPYLELVDPKYYSKNLIKTLKTPQDYEEVLMRIAKDDSKKLIKKISQYQIDSIYSLLLSETHQLQVFSEEVTKAVQQKTSMQKEVTSKTATVTTQEETIVPEQQTTAQNAESSGILITLIDGFYNLQTQARQLTDAEDATQIVQDKNAMKEAFKTIEESYAKLRLKRKDIASFLAAINQLEAAVHNSEVESHQLIIDNLKNIRTQFGVSIVKQADDAEFTLGLNPGSLSGPISEYFDSFYKGLLDRIVQTNEQSDLQLLVDTTPTKKRLEDENKRLESLLASKTYSRAEDKSKAINIELSKNRIDYLTKLLENEENVKTPKKIDVFKEQKFDQHIKDILRESLGTYAEAFYKEIKPSLKALQEEILKDISIKDNIEDKIKASSLQAQFKKVMSEIIVSPTSEHNAKLKQSYEGFITANEQLLKIKEKKSTFEALMKDNLLINRIVKEIEQFEDKVMQFSKEYQPGDELAEHDEMISSFLSLLDKYDFFITKVFQDRYLAFKDKKLDLINTQNPIGKEELESMRFFEDHILAFAKEHEPLEIQRQFDDINSVAADYAKIMMIFDLNRKIIASLGPLSQTLNQSTPQGEDILKKLEFAQKMEKILLDPIPSPQKRLESAAAHLKSIEQPKPAPFDRIGIFFTEIIEKIRIILTGDKLEETKVLAKSEFNKYKKGIHDILPEKEEPSQKDNMPLEQHHDLH